MANVDWKSLEGKPWKLDVGSSMEKALQSKDNSTLHVTTDGGIAMNGEIIGRTNYLEFIHSDSIFALSPGATENDIFYALAIKLPTGDVTYKIDEISDAIVYASENGGFIYDDEKRTRVDIRVYLGEDFNGSILHLERMSMSHNRPCLEYAIIKVEENEDGYEWTIVSSSKGSSIINEPKLSEPDFKVCVRKALPMYPRKGMKYYFDNGVKYNLPKKEAFDNGFTFTVPEDGNTWVVCLLNKDNLEQIVPNGTVIDKTNLLKYFPWAGEVEGIYTVITRKTNEPVLITIVKDMESVFKKGTFKEACAPKISCDCRKKYRRIVDGKVRYDIPIPDLRKGESVFDSKYAIFKYRWKRVKYYGENPPEGMKLNDRKTIIIDGKEKKSYRMIRSDRKGTVYVARQIPLRKVGRRSHPRYILSPKVKCFVDENLKIIKRL